MESKLSVLSGLRLSVIRVRAQQHPFCYKFVSPGTGPAVKMEKLISSWLNIESVPESYVLPPGRRPGKHIFPILKNIPVIDLQGGFPRDRTEIIQKILDASQEYGFFQLINHSVPEELMHETLMVAEEFFELPMEDKVRFYSEDPKQDCRLYTSIDYEREKVHFWRDNLKHSCHPLEAHMQSWPLRPTGYREVVGKYAVEVRKLSLWILEIICEGLGVEAGYFGTNLSQVQVMGLNHYPACPDPSLTLGLPKHSDVNLITLLYQGEIPGLQVLKDEQWFTVEPIPNAIVVNIGHMLQIISNGKLKSADHRVVTNTSVARTTVGSFILPSGDSHIQPIKSMVNEHLPAVYRDFIFKDFLTAYVVDTYEGNPPLERYLLRSLSS